MDQRDKELLNVIQKDFPLSPRPFQEIGESLGMGEKEVIERLEALKSGGLIRRLGGVFDPGGLGYCSTLVALEVQGPEIEKIARAVNQFSQVTHNYQRDHRYNLWFTIIAGSPAEIKEIVGLVRCLPGVQSLLELPQVRRFKIETSFTFEVEEGL